MVDERKMILELISYQERLVRNGNIEDSVPICDIIKWIAEQPQVTPLANNSTQPKLQFSSYQNIQSPISKN